MLYRIAFIPIFLFVFAASATDACTDPFVGEKTLFTLTEPLTCNPAQAVYRLEISSGVYLEPSCIGNHKVLDLYLNNGQNIRSFSNEEPGQTNWGNVQVSSACTGQNLFTIQPNYYVPGIGSVSPEENTVNRVTLRNNQTQIIASATKSLISEGPCGKAVWTVTNKAEPQVMAYLLALKDNHLFTCPVSTKNPDEHTGLSAGAVVGIAIAVALPITIGSFFLYRWIHRHYPGFFKRKAYDSLPNDENLQ